MAKVAALKEEVKQLNDRLRPLTRTFNVEVEGQVRRVAADLAEVQGKLDNEISCRREAEKKRTLSDKAARELADEREQLLSKVAALSSSYASLIGKHATSAKKARAESRQAAQRERQLLAQLANAQIRAERAEARVEVADEADGRAAAAERRALEAEAAADELVAEAEATADDAIAEAAAATADAEAARKELTDADYLQVVLQGKLDRAVAKAAEKGARVLQQKYELLKGPSSRSFDDWATLTREAEYKAAQRERLYLSNFLKSHNFRAKDLADGLDELNLVAPLFKTQPFFNQHFQHVEELIHRMEQNDFGEVFGHYTSTTSSTSRSTR